MKSAETEPQTDLARELCKAGDNCEKQFTAVPGCMLVGDNQAPGFLDVKVPRWKVFFYERRAGLPTLDGRGRPPSVKRGEKNRSLANRHRLPDFRLMSRLAGRADVGNMNHAGAAVEVAVNLDLLAYELLGFVLIIQLIV
jgi:hypothetical protein